MKMRVQGVINLIHDTDDLGTLTAQRCLATVPFGGRYRLIDFMLSSMVNSDISKIAVFAHTKYRSLMDHLGSGKHWDLDRRERGLFVLPPASDDIQELSRGDLYHFYQNRDYFNRSKEEFVVIARSHVVCNMDLRPIVAEHLARGADITVVCKQQADELIGKARKLSIDERGRVLEMQDYYGRLQSDLQSMEIYILRKELLIELVESSLAQGQDHLIRHAVTSRLSQLQVYAHLYQGYLGLINTMESYYYNNLNLLQPAIWNELFHQSGTIFTKVKDEPPAKYYANATVNQSLIANGCRIEGTVRNSILFRGVHVQKGAVVENSIIMQNGIIGPKSLVSYSILDKDVCVDAERVIMGARSAPFMASKRKVI